MFYNDINFPDDIRTEISIFALKAISMDESRPPHERQHARDYMCMLGDLGSIDFETLRCLKDKRLYFSNFRRTKHFI